MANNRRSFLKGAAAAAAAIPLAGLRTRPTQADSELLESLPQNVNTNSRPSDLKITDLRVLVI